MKTPKRFPTGSVLALALTVLAVAGFWIWHRPQQASLLAVHQHHDRYQCPMHPQIVEDHPGECPICHMRLVKVDDGGDDSASVAQTRQAPKVVKYRNPMDPTVFSDHPMKDSMGMDYIPVTVTEQSVDSDAVDGKAGFTLSQERQQLIGVRFTAAEWRSLSRTVRLPGRLLEGGQVLAQLLEIDAGTVRVGMKARLEGPGGAQVDAKVRHIDGNLDSLTRSFGVRLQAAKVADWFRPGVYCLALVDVEMGQRLAVPQDAVLDTGERQVVFVTDGQGHFEPRQVVLGLSGDDWIEVKQGLKEGDQVVTSANFLIDSESRFRAALDQL